MTAVGSTASWKSSINRSRTTNDPLRRADGRTSAGRRIRDLYRAYLACLPTANDATKAAVLAAAELVAAAETARTQLLAGTADIEQLVRLENLANRAVRRLGIKHSDAPPLTIRDRLIAEAEARAEAGDDDEAA
jgi:hypothetical protein